MAWNNADSLVVANNGQVYVAPLGTALPTTPTATLNAAFVGLGLINEDGATITVNPDFTDFMSWQAQQPVRSQRTALNVQAAFGLQQWDENTVPLALGGGSVSNPSGSIYRYDLPDETATIDDRALVIDAKDGSENHRWVFPKAHATESVETQYRRSAEAILPITMRILAPSTGGSPGYYLTDSAAFAAGS